MIAVIVTFIVCAALLALIASAMKAVQEEIAPEGAPYMIAGALLGAMFIIPRALESGNGLRLLVGITLLGFGLAILYVSARCRYAKKD